MTGGSRNEDVIALEPGMILRQSVIAGEDSLSGIGVRLVQEEGQIVRPDDIFQPVPDHIQHQQIVHQMRHAEMQEHGGKKPPILPFMDEGHIGASPFYEDTGGQGASDVTGAAV